MDSRLRGNDKGGCGNDESRGSNNESGSGNDGCSQQDLRSLRLYTSGKFKRIPYYSKRLVTLWFRPGQLEAEDVHKQALEVLQDFCSIADLLRGKAPFQAVSGERA
jgi:hypothetical protein